MISQLINYLAGLPTATTSPLYVALNVPELVEAMGEATEIKVIDTRTSEMDPPFIRLADSNEANNFQDFVGGRYRCYIEQLFLNVEVAAYGPSASVAASRADYLRLAAEGAIQSLISGFSPSDLPGYTDLAGSGASDEIFLVRLVGGRANPPVMGPGTETVEHWTATRNFRVEVQVKRTRLKAA